MAKILGVVGFLIAALWTALALAQPQPNSVEAFNVSQQGGNVVVKLTLKEALKAQPGSFTVANPARIAVDLPNTVNNLGRNSQSVGEGDLVSMNMVQASGRTRMVLNLRQLVSYDTKIEVKDLLVVLSSAPVASASGGTVVTHFAEAKQVETHALRNIDFRRGKSGEGRIVVDLSDSSTGIDIRQQGQNLVIDFFKTALPDQLRRRLDVTDFGTPVQSINTFAQGDNVRMVIAPKGLWEHSAYQTDNEFVVEVKQVVPDPNKLGQGNRFTGEKLSLNFQNVEVRSVLNVIADFTDLNIITSDSVGGSLTLRLKDVPWDQALQIILDTRGLDMRRNGNVIWIAPRDELATKEKLALESQQQIGELEPVRTESFVLNYQKAKDVQTLLTSPNQKVLSKRGSAVVYERTNTVFVQDVPARLEEVRKLIAQIDVPVRQVMIEARIVEANDTFSKNLGAKLGYNTIKPGGQRLLGPSARYTVGGNLTSTGQLTTSSTGQQLVAGTPDITQTQNVNLPATGVGGFNPAAFSMILFNKNYTQFITMELSALEADGKGKIISSPRVLTGDKVEALIEQGTELPYQQATSSGATSVSFRKANLSLKVKPQITPDGNIIMTLDINKDSVGQVTAAGFAIDTKHVKTEVLVENGGTVVIGGIYTQDERNTTTKVPVFGDIPVLGNLFRNNSRQDNKTELLVFITPRIVDDRLTIR